MFPIPFNMPYRKPDGTLTTIGDVIASGGGGGEVDGVYLGETDPDNAIGEDGDFYLKFRKTYGNTPLIPVISDNTHVIFDKEWTGGGGNAWHLFDGDLTTYWSTRENENTNAYCGYDFGAGNEVIATSAGICPRYWSPNLQIQDFKIQASNDNETWVDLYTGTFPNNHTYAGEMNYFEFENETAYRYYRLFVANAYASKTITVFEFQIYIPEIEPNNVEVIDTFKKVDGEWVNSLMGYRFKTKSTSGSDASIEVFINQFGEYTSVGVYKYNEEHYSDENVSLSYVSNAAQWKLTPKTTLYDAEGNEVTEQTWSYTTSKDIIWYVYDPT